MVVTVKVTKILMLLVVLEVLIIFVMVTIPVVEIMVTLIVVTEMAFVLGNGSPVFGTCGPWFESVIANCALFSS